MDYIETINAINVYYNTDSGAMPIALLGSILFITGIICIILYTTNKISNNFILDIAVPCAVIGFGLMSIIVFCVIEPDNIIGTNATVPIYDVKFDSNISMFDIETKYIIVEKSKDFEDSYKVIIKDDIGEYNFVNSDSNYVNKINGIIDNYSLYE